MAGEALTSIVRDGESYILKSKLQYDSCCKICMASRFLNDCNTVPSRLAIALETKVTFTCADT